MSNRRASRGHRCPRCQINQELCFCEYITEISNITPVLVVMHWREKWLTSNSTNLAIQSLSQVKVEYRGIKEKGPVSLDWINRSKYTPIYLFPSEEAKPLTKEELGKLPLPPALVIPDGTWSQAIKFHRREDALAKLPHYRLEGEFESKYQLRKTHFPGALSTLEALAKALGVIESKEIEQKLEAMLEVMVERVLLTRNKR